MRSHRERSLLANSGHGLLRCTCPLMTQSGLENWNSSASEKTVEYLALIRQFGTFLSENSVIKRWAVCDVLIIRDDGSLHTNTWLRFSRPQMYSSPVRQLDIAPNERPTSFNDVLRIFGKMLWEFHHYNTSLDCGLPIQPGGRLFIICRKRGYPPYSQQVRDRSEHCTHHDTKKSHV
jgi:hypothetical protein